MFIKGQVKAKRSCCNHLARSNSIIPHAFRYILFSYIYVYVFMTYCNKGFTIAHELLVRHARVHITRLGTNDTKRSSEDQRN